MHVCVAIIFKHNNNVNNYVCRGIMMLGHATVMMKYTGTKDIIAILRTLWA